MEVEEIRCFQHCDRSKNILCFVVPPVCPLCGADVLMTPMRIPPYLLESPFTNGSYTQCCVLVKPTVGDFLYSFDNNSDLHIGLSSSNGIVYEYDERGISKGSSDWSNCISVNVGIVDAEPMETWNTKLKNFSEENVWSAENYNEQTFNCYDFVLGFLQFTGLGDVYDFVMDKRLFCEQMIVPATTKAGKYISLYRNISSLAFVIQEAK